MKHDGFEKKPPGNWVQTERKAHEAWAALIRKSPMAAQVMHYLTSRIGEHNAVVISQKPDSIKDGSDAVSDWPLLNALLNTARAPLGCLCTTVVA